MADNPTVSQEIEREVHIPIVMESINISGQERNDKIVTSIEKMLKRLPRSSSERCICKIPVILRELNLKAYTPQIVSIGPFHHGKEHLQAMEEHKLRYLESFLGRTGKSLKYCVEFVGRHEEKARRCYADTIRLKNDEFVKMILVDGSFIVEFLLRLDGNYESCQPWMAHTMANDILLLENQLPFFVLEDLYNLVPVSNLKRNQSFSELAHSQFCELCSILPKGELPTCSSEIMHFVDFLHRCCCPSISVAWPTDKLPDTISSSKIMHIVDFMHCCCRSSVPEVQHSVDGSDEDYVYPPTATELREAGIKFKKGINCSLFDIKFRNGIMEIPPLVIWDETEVLIRNLIAFEQCHSTDELILDYMFLFDGMINTSKDVDLLIREGIIDCKLGSSEDVSALFNNICTHVVARPGFHYSTLCKALHAYCKKPCHNWEATLRRDYFNTPWKVVSLSVALVLLVLTSIQAVCSIISLKAFFFLFLLGSYPFSFLTAFV